MTQQENDTEHYKNCKLMLKDCYRCLHIWSELRHEKPVGYKDLPIPYIKHSSLKKSVTSLLAFTGLFGGMALGMLTYFLLQGTFLHPRPLFGLLAGFGFLMGMVFCADKLNKRWRLE